jgi:transcriptional regulator with XRE-family HTH domain
VSLLDVYLQKNGKKRYDVFKQTGLSQQMLAAVNKKNVSSYSVKTIQAIAETVEKSEGTVLDELLQLEKKTAYFEVYNTEDLLLAFANKESHILITEDYKKEIEELAKTQLSETETLGLELGSSGTIYILGEIFYQLTLKLSNKNTDQKKLENDIRKYKLKKLNEKEYLLYYKHLDY